MPARLIALLLVLAAATPAAVSGADEAAVVALQTWFEANFRDGETQLVAGASDDRMALGDEYLVCGGLPALQTRSSSVPPNGACPDAFTAANGSCTCLTGVSNSSETWSFRVRLKDAADSSRGSSNGDAYPTTQAATEILEIDAIRPLWVPATLRTLRFAGIGESPLALTLVPEDRSGVGNSSPIAQAAGASVAVTTIEFSNIDLYATALTAGALLPSSATDITLRDCNISSFGYDFAETLGSIKTIDLSQNQLTKPYAGSTIYSACSYTLCALEEFNISFNRMTEFPSTAMNVKTLRKLFIQGNPLSDWNVTAAVFELIQGLDEFDADSPDESSLACDGGQWETAHGVSFCVTSDSDGASATSEAAADSTTTALKYVAIAGALLVVVLAVALVWQRRRHNAERRLDDHRLDTNGYSQSAIIGTTTRGENDAARALIMREPHLAAQRVDYRDIKLTKCLSRGGFGLVFAGELHGRRVAVKKMRADLGVEFHQLELFVREIALLARLQHERIVEFVGISWETASLMDLAAITELMEGGDLREVLYYHNVQRQNHTHTGSSSSSLGEEGVADKDGVLTWSGAKLKIALHLAQALAYLHSLSPPVVHRDLKSKNVLLTSELDAKLGDFGIARERPNEGEDMMTAGMGTNFWIAPEVLLGEDYDESADIFSFGVVLSEIDTDDFPYWNAEHPAGGRIEEGEILQLVAMGRKRPAFSAECPPAILALASRCLSVSPHERPSAVELVHHLGGLEPKWLLERRPPESAKSTGVCLDVDGEVKSEDVEWSPRGEYSLSDFDEDSSRRYWRLDDSARAVRIRHEGLYS